MKNLRYILPALLIILLTACAAPPSTPAPEGLEQSASWVVREDQVMRLAAGAEGRGTLLFRGWEHPFKFTGARVTVTGTKTGDIEGEVYNLNKLEDIEGTYYAKPDLDKNRHVTGFWRYNDKGVVLHLRVQGEGLSPTHRAAPLSPCLRGPQFLPSL